MGIILFTGFPGFLGSELLPRVLERRPQDRALCLIQAKFRGLAERRVAELAGDHPGVGDRIALAEGDITRPGLGLAPRELAANEVREVYHLAAVYDLNVSRAVAVRVNLDGTSHVLDFCQSCDQLERLHYVSTCYVSGRWAGIFREEDLDKGQTFNNYYEETKFLAEVEVQRRMAEGLPATIYRPAIVVGDSRTGATQKYDGPYFIIRWVLRQPFLATVPVVGDPSAVRVNVVPREFVVEAIAHLSGIEASAGKVYQLADPAPLTVDEILSEVGHATGRMLLRIPLPLGAAKAAIDHVPASTD
jgi:thioester reductase-like protein